MKIKLKEIVNSSEPLVGLMKKPLKAKVAFKLSKTLKKIQDELEIYNTVRNTLIEKFGSKDDEDNMFIEPSSKEMVKFNKELTELLDSEISLKVDKVKLSQLAKLEIPPVDFMVLDWLIEDK